ncbi:MAG: NADP-dependent isocitrate dehydrogenase, partial [Bacteroidetes bacterium]|nr:NADP-dependent isocitrate dehydrogenase [Bacteroidota bacterium]
MNTIYYTMTDEAPALATNSFLPLIKKITEGVGVKFRLKDISLSSRILAAFSDRLPEEYKTEDALAQLGELAKLEGTTIIKLPNISASMAQLKAAIKELQDKGIAVPDYPDNPTNDGEKEVKLRYDKIKGSAVNPVLREGNSDRRAPKAVKNFARNNPHSMGPWSSSSATRVKTMDSGDFKHTEQSLTLDRERKVSIVLTTTDQRTVVLKSALMLAKKEIIDVSVMQKQALQSFFNTAYAEAKSENVLLSLHLKATMMKVSDPIIFGHALSAYFNDLFTFHSYVLQEVNINLNEGLQSVLNSLEANGSDGALKLRSAILDRLTDSAEWAMVNS